MAKKSSTLSSNAIFLLVVLAFQFGLHPIFVRSFGREAIKSSMMLCTELMKAVICGLIYFGQECKFRFKSWNLSDSVQTSALPALLFAVQNYLVQIACQNMDPMLFTLLNQTKTLFAALCSYLLLGRRQSLMQIVALALLMIAACILQIKVGDFQLQSESILNFTFVTMLGACLISGVTAAITQGILQIGGRSGYLYSFEISLYSLIWVAISILLGSADGKEIFEKGLFFGWNSLTWLPVMNTALGGIIVGQVTKYAGSVEKGFALVGGILVSAVFQFILFSIPLTHAHWMAFVLVTFSIWMHSNFPYEAKRVTLNPKRAETKKID